MPSNVWARPRAARIPAWVLSVALHALLLIALGLAIRPAPPRSRDASERTVGIALAHITRPRVEYLVEDDASAASAPRAALATDASGEASSATAQALPEEEPPSRVASQLALPTAVDALPDIPGGLNVPRTTGQPSRRLPHQTDYSEWVQQEAARLRARKPSGPTANLSLFGGAPATGRSFVFLLDRSKSMGSGGLNALAAAERELSAALSTLQPTHRFAVLAYHHEVVYLDEPRLLPATPAQTQRLAKFFGGLAAYGQTEHAYGIEAALALAPDVVYIFSDAGEPPPTPIAQKKIIREAQRQGTTLHALRFGFGPLRDEGGFLRTLADATGGGFTYINMAP